MPSPEEQSQQRLGPTFPSKWIWVCTWTFLLCIYPFRCTTLTDVVHVDFYYTGTSDKWGVPIGVSLINLTVFGANGGCGCSNLSSPQVGGKGGLTMSTLAVMGGQIVDIYVGGAGSDLSSGVTTVTGGFNGE